MYAQNPISLKPRIARQGCRAFNLRRGKSAEVIAVPDTLPYGTSEMDTIPMEIDGGDDLMADFNSEVPVVDAPTGNDVP